MFEFEIKVEGSAGVDQITRLHSFSVPFKAGEFNTKAFITFDDPVDGSQLCAFEALSFWPDGSIKWAKVYVLINLQANQSKTLLFRVQDQITADDTAAPCPAQKPLNTSLNSTSQTNNEPLDYRVVLIDQNKCQHTCVFEPFGDINKLETAQFRVLRRRFKSIVELNTSIEIIVEQESITITNSDKKDGEPNNVVRTSVTIHNPDRALHDGGQWDLGDPNSVYFEALLLEKPNSDKVFKPKAEDEIATEVGEIAYFNLSDENGLNNWQTGERRVNITQYSSGGENWQSNVHVDAFGKVPFSKKGYEIDILSADDSYTINGDRISPIITTTVNSGSFQVYLADFWQNFPSSLSATIEKTTVGLFPKVGYLHELQPGEKKTQTVLFGGNVGNDTFLAYCSAINTKVDPSYIEQTKAIPFFSSKPDPELTELINLGLEPHCGFDAKKEHIDEYGWRNFGDLYADHENAEFKGEGDIISHYNNQYDPIYGFLRQYLQTGEQRWFGLADELAKHVCDIDIYDTTKDRAEYNGGLFWHTDHYVDAATASHRTYSKNQPKDVYMDHAGGGGPGGQHCYTTGLMLHHFLTGSFASKNAVLKLTNWITHVYEGTGGILDFLLAYKNRNRIDLKNVETGQYPLDRGTGHYIFAMLDSYELTGHQSWLDKVSLVIKQTAHPQEDLSERNLENVEETWYYTVFLQAVVRYLWTKENAQQIDESYFYSVNVLQLFGNWMANNERPYLTKPEILEFPNSTWTAQDLRKVNVLSAAAAYSADDKDAANAMRAKANEIRDYIINNLKQDENRDYCRILCILMQNEGWKEFFGSQHESLAKSISRHCDVSMSRTAGSVSLPKELWQRISSLSIKRELEWLTSRSDKLDKVINKD